jgi:hypothetical protein
MSKIYSDSHEELYKLLQRASSETGATLLIPDLQRPYVWTPSQVVLLLDSLIRGWPFGTLLLWDVHESDLSKIPSRPFWRMVDRTIEEGGTQVTQQNPPATYNMVLDGQQRIQSLILALGGDAWGFKLYDKDWHVERGNRPQRSAGGNRHWSVGTLCIDLDALSTEFSPESGIPGVDFTKVLQWVVTDSVNGRSNIVRGPKYEDPIAVASNVEQKGKYVRLSRLWDKAPAKEGLEAEQYQRLIAPILDEHEVPHAKSAAVIRPLTSLATAFSRVKLTRVSYLRVERLDTSVQSEQAYTDAVVGIFTRLNTAGRTLTREEITFAWLKVGWTRSKTGGLGATECFKKLLDELRSLDLPVELDDLVAGTSFAWAVHSRDGALLSDRDLLKKDIIHPMADDLSETWQILQDSFCAVAELLKERRVEFRSHYQSLNALWILCTWKYLAEIHENSFPTSKPAEIANYRAAIQQIISECIDRWFFCSSWAGRWGRASGQIMSGYATRLSELNKRLGGESKSLVDAAAWLSMFIKDEVDAFIVDANAEVDRLAAESRDQVRNYYSYLWIWHRIDAARWQMSKTPLRETEKKKPSIEVDHVVAVKLWEDANTGEPSTDEERALVEGESISGYVNRLGNSLLLEKTFNISKKQKPLKELLEQLKDFKTDSTHLAAWSSAMHLATKHCDPTGLSKLELYKLIESRETAMKIELKEFIKGLRPRHDL